MLDDSFLGSWSRYKPDWMTPYKVTGPGGKVVAAYETREEAEDSAEARNKRAEQWGLKARYAVVEGK